MIVPDSILKTLRKACGLDVEDDSFDIDICLQANTIFSYLNQIGVGPSNFVIESENTSWESFIPEEENLEAVKTYMFLRVKMIFDPPTASNVAEAYNDNIAEAEWRINAFADPAFKGGAANET